MNKTIVIYHAGCRDGFCAAWVVNKYFQERTRQRIKESKEGFIFEPGLEYYPAFYGQEPPDVKDYDVIIVDFAYAPEVMSDLMSDSNSLIWLDHHKTAESVAGLFEQLKGDFRKYKFVFDLSRSGAGLSWDYFFPNETSPWLVDYVEDRDLWRKKLHESDKVNAYIACLEFSFDIWNIAANMSLGDAIYHGKTAEMKTEQYVREACKNVYFANIQNPLNLDMIFDDGYVPAWKNIPTVNICQVDCSEVMAELLKLYPESLFSLYWFKRADGLYQYGMRSSVGDFDVGAVAKLFGGGGHRNAAGFQLSYLLEELK